MIPDKYLSKYTMSTSFKIFKTTKKGFRILEFLFFIFNLFIIFQLLSIFQMIRIYQKQYEVFVIMIFCCILLFTMQAEQKTEKEHEYFFNEAMELKIVEHLSELDEEKIEDIKILLNKNKLKDNFNEIYGVEIQKGEIRMHHIH